LFPKAGRFRQAAVNHLARFGQRRESSPTRPTSWSCTGAVVSGIFHRFHWQQYRAGTAGRLHPRCLARIARRWPQELLLGTLGF
jgi:hypothetical protein